MTIRTATLKFIFINNDDFSCETYDSRAEKE